MDRLRVGVCEDNEELVVQIFDDEEGWMCCHNNDMEEIYEEDLERDALDVKELQRDPSGETCNWCNPYLRYLQENGINYKEY